MADIKYALKWHNTGDNKFEAGVSNVALFVMDDNGYKTGVAWNGVTAINENPSGADATDLYADDKKNATVLTRRLIGRWNYLALRLKLIPIRMNG